MIAGLEDMATSRARQALWLSLWTAGAVFVLGSGTVAARMASLDDSRLTQIDERQDPRKLFPETEEVEREALDVRPPAIEQVTLASVWPIAEDQETFPADALPIAEPAGSEATDYAAEMSYQPDVADSAALVETLTTQPVPGVIECAETCVDAHVATTGTVETSMADTVNLPVVTPSESAVRETVILDDILPGH